MKTKIISISICLMLIFMSLVCAEAIAPTPRVDLDEYQLTVTNTSDVYITGTLSICVGQDVGVFESNGRVMYNSVTMQNTNSKGTFKLQIPSRYLTSGTNTFKIKSTPVKNVINGSNSKTLTVIVKNSTTKKDQTITCSNLTLYKGEKKNLNAKVSSSLPLTYMSNNTSIAIVDAKGNVTGKTKGTTSIVVKQSGNNLYKSTSKTVTVTVKEKSGGTDSKNTYTVVFNPNGGKGSTSPQKIEVGKYEQLNANKFTRDGYEFVGWATSSNKQVISGTDVTKFKNVDMKHFQLGKVSYKNKAKVKNLANKNTQIVLYAVWKGNGPRAALDWGKLIADDNHFMYNTKKKSNKTFGCYFCGDNKKKGKKVFNGGKHYVCMTFVDACYAHGANCKSFWSSNGTCNGTYIDGNSRISKIKKKARLNTIWYSYNGNKHGKKPSLNSLKPGDILVTQKAKGGHVVMYWGKNSKGEHLMLECTHSSRAKGKSGQIALHNVSKWYSKTCQAVFRFKG